MSHTGYLLQGLPFRPPSSATNGLAPRIGTDEYRSRGVPGPVEAAVRQMKNANPGALLMEIGFHGTSALDGVRMLKSVCPQAEILVLAVYDDRAVPVTWEAWRDMPAGGALHSPEAPRRVIALLRKMHPAETREYTLTVQETRVLRLLGEGHHYKTAAAYLGVTLNTLSFHVRRIYDKLHVHSKAEAVAKALRDGILH